ncbi:MAG TPA: hypothetical protein DCM54_02645 [Gammaproteobacteria bacterium]|nr:hypothetical protein [Gammaproteobacteria bacterium]
MRLLLAASLLAFLPYINAQPPGVKLMSLNIAHARATGLSQLLQSEAQARHNLSQIAIVVRRESLDIIALQEVDRDPFWNGSFDHGEFIALQAQYPHYYTGSHQTAIQLDYGTALLSKSLLQNSQTLTFTPSLARTRKGFVISSIDWSEHENLKVDVVSLHLDFLSDSKRRREIDKLIETLEPRDVPKIIMGDFNTSYEDPRLIPHLSPELDLHTWDPMADLTTFTTLDRGLDWVLISSEFRFVDHRVLPDPLSDHRAIIAEITLRQHSDNIQL